MNLIKSFMRINKLIVFFFLFSFIFVSCNNETEDDALQNKSQATTEEFEAIEILFDDTKFDDPKAVELLKEIHICSDTQLDADGNVLTPCTPDNFKFFPLKEGASLDDGFVLLIKATTGGVAVRRVLVFERENGVLVKTNGFIANLIGAKKNKGGNDDLLLRFIDKIEGSDYYYNCIFSWENGKYAFKTVEVISQPSANFNRRVKADVKDSVSKEINQILIDNQMIF